MKIFTYNRSGGKIPYTEFIAALRAVNYQIKNHFVPAWGMPATLVYQRTDGPASDSQTEDRAVLYVVREADVDGALGYHAANNRGTPYGFVFLDIAEQIGEPWSVTLSHEALELIADPLTNLLAAGPHPRYPSRLVFHWLEMSDAVQNDTYEINGVAVSDFVLPHYFTVDEEPIRQNRFLQNLSLPSFGVAQGGYVGFYDPRTGSMDTYMARGDKRAALRLKIKRGRGMLGRSGGYTNLAQIVAKKGILGFLAGIKAKIKD